ncbi:ScyD/ScyE family protein [Streptomyces sp. NPDC090106]|uniref:ScyD/ScyE family protein n=1 Tax=Streptomyces sp. NPDC090106 TaxID=3365946 RepID=UPI003804E323
MSNPRRSLTRTIIAATACVVAAPLATAGVAGAATTGADAATATTIEVVASGLKNPRDVTALPDGSLLVAESGEGLPGCAVGSVCLGDTGSVYKVKGSWQGRVVTGLPSYGPGVAPGNAVYAIGPANVLPDPKGGYLVLYSGGFDAAGRAALGPAGAPLGTLSRTRDGSVVADYVALETQSNPDGREVYSNPWKVLRSGGGYLVTDAGANTLLRTAGGTTSTEFVMPLNENDRDGVPTGIVKGSDGKLYIAGLGVYAGQSRIYKVGANGPELWVDGLTNVVDLAVAPNGDLIALTYTPGYVGDPPQPSKVLKIDPDTAEVTEIPTGDRLIMGAGLDVDKNGRIVIVDNARNTDGELLRLTY